MVVVLATCPGCNAAFTSQRSWDGPQEAHVTLHAGEAVIENEQMNVTRHSQPAQMECCSYD